MRDVGFLVSGLKRLKEGGRLIAAFDRIIVAEQVFWAGPVGLDRNDGAAGADRLGEGADQAGLP